MFRADNSSNTSLLTTDELASRLGLKTQTLAVWRLKGQGPRFVKIGLRAVRYSENDVNDWLGKRGRQNTSEVRHDG